MAAVSTCATAAARTEIRCSKDLDLTKDQQAQVQLIPRSLSPEGGFASAGWRRGARQHEGPRSARGHVAGDERHSCGCSTPISKKFDDRMAKMKERRASTAIATDTHGPPSDGQNGSLLHRHLRVIEGRTQSSKYGPPALQDAGPFRHDHSSLYCNADGYCGGGAGCRASPSSGCRGRPSACRRSKRARCSGVSTPRTSSRVESMIAAQRVSRPLPEAVDLHASFRENTVHSCALQRIEAELLTKVTIALRAEGRPPMRHRRELMRAHVRGPPASVIIPAAKTSEQEAHGKSAAPCAGSVAHGCTCGQSRPSRVRSRDRSRWVDDPPRGAPRRALDRRLPRTMAVDGHGFGVARHGEPDRADEQNGRGDSRAGAPSAESSARIRALSAATRELRRARLSRSPTTSAFHSAFARAG